MKRTMSTACTIGVACTLMVITASHELLAVKSPNGFAVWSKGSGYDRTLHRIELKENAMPDMSSVRKVTNKGPKGGDIMPVISYDGKWVAFSRDVRGADDWYGPNDYHHEEAFDVFIVRVDGDLPNNNVIHVDRGTWANWGRTGGGQPKDVDGDFGPPYTLYYSQINGGIMKCTIGADGKVSNKQLHASIGGRFKMCAPNGRYVAHYPGHIAIKDLQTGKQVDGNSFSCHPSFGADSYWVLYARQWASNILGDKVYTGIGDYHFGTSNDMEWAISRRKQSGNDQNTAHEIGVWKMEAGAHTISFEFQFDVGMGNFPDLHVFTNVSIGSFKATPPAIITGALSTLSWTTSSATSVTLNGEAVALNGSKSVSPSQTTTYTLRAEGKGSPVEKQVTVEVGPPVLSSITVVPSDGRIALGQSATLTARNQIDGTIAAQWSLTSGGGTLSATSGESTVFTAGTVKGTYGIRASAGGEQIVREIVVFDPSDIHVKVNCGGPDNGDWQSDNAFLGATKGESFQFSGAMNTNGVTGAAPAAVYGTVRHYAHDYSFGDIPDGNYIVRIHFVDGYDQFTRNMDYRIEGETVLEEFNPVQAAGGKNIVIVKEFAVTVADGNGLQIQPQGQNGSDVFEAAIEILADDAGMTVSRAAEGAKSTDPCRSVHLDSRGVTVGGPIDDLHSLEIVDLHGQVLLTLAVTSRTLEWGAGRLAPGTYCLRLRGRGVAVSRRFVVRGD